MSTMLLSEFKSYLSTTFATTTFYNGAIDKNSTQCVGIYYAKSAPQPNIAIGGIDNSSYEELSAILLVHWTENSNTCETKARELYDHFLGKSNFSIGDRRIVATKVSGPVDVARDENNICEMTIQITIQYER
jgi:hypothetical protein